VTKNILIAVITPTAKKGAKILTLVTPKDLSAIYSESPDIFPIQKIVEKKTPRGNAIGISVIPRSEIIDKIKETLTSDDDINCITRNNSKVSKNMTKKIVLTTKGKTKLEAKYTLYNLNITSFRLL
jgi:hypothetical protein